MFKINKHDVTNCDIDIFGDWINQDLKVHTNPYKYCILTNFLKEDVYENIFNAFPEKPNEHFYKYYNPIEVKYALDKFDFIDDKIKNLFYALSHEKLIQKFKDTFKIDNLEYDPYLHGGGIHMHPKNGRLNMHLDYEKHPLMNKQRRLNIIFYVNKEWKQEWNGDTQLWDSDMKQCVVKSYPKFNTAIIFETSELSWHGVPEIISCPQNDYRKSIAYYYVSPLVNKKDNNKVGANNKGYRTKATFVKRPNDEYDERMETLYKIRPNRRITEDDMKLLWPEWKA